MNSFLVTGATGFIGSCLTRALVAKNKKVSIITRNKELNWRLKDIASKINIYECDLRSKELENVILKIKPDYIFHLAAYGSLPQEDKIDLIIDINLKGTINLIQALKNIKFRLMINTGSSSEYGIKNVKMNEDDVITPINDYGVIKSAQTLYCQKEGVKENLPIITLRLFSPYGYFENKSRLIPTLILNAINNKPISLSSPNNVRDFIFIEDVCDAYLKATEKVFKKGEIINIGMGKQQKTKKIAENVLKLAKSKSRLIWNTISNQKRQVEPEIWEADITKAETVLNWVPRYSLVEGLSKTIDWFKTHQHLYA